MAVKKKDNTTKERPSRQHVKGENFYRSAKKVKQVNMLKNQSAQRDKEGNITQAAPFQSRDTPSARIAPDRRWFNSTRVISQDTLKAFREAMAGKANDPHTFLLRRNKLPMGLLDTKEPTAAEAEKAAKRIHEPNFGGTFGPRAQRKRITLGFSSFEDLHDKAKLDAEKRDAKEEEDQEMGEDDGGKETARDSIFSKGQSHRIWSELHKVIDASDVVMMVLDARDPEGTRCEAIEKHIANDCPHKHLIFILNKCDLVPVKATAAWVRYLGKVRPTLAFRANMKNPFGKGSLISLLRQFQILHKDRRTITASVVGYPNAGKSSILNTLRSKKVCVTAPIPGETKVWQYVSMSKSLPFISFETERILLLDAPGVVPRQTNIDPTKILLRGALRVEHISEPSSYIHAVLARVEPKHLARTYNIEPTTDVSVFLETLGRRMGRLNKGGEVDCDEVARLVIRDFLRGNLPWFTPPPLLAGADGEQPKPTEAQAGVSVEEAPKTDGAVDEDEGDDSYEGIPEDEMEEDDEDEEDEDEEDEEDDEDDDDDESDEDDAATKT